MHKLIILSLLFASCSSRHTQRSQSTIDSTVIKENQMLKEALEASSQTIEKLVKDSSGTEIIFQTDTVVKTVVQFEKGKIVRVEGPVRTVRVSDTHLEQSRDSLQSLVYSYQDSLQKEQANKKVEIRTVEKVVKRFPWFWIILAFIAGAIGGAYLCYYIMERKKDRVYEKKT